MSHDSNVHLLLIAALLGSACATPPPPQAPAAPALEPLAPEPPPAPEPEPDPQADAPVQDCGQDPIAESPIVRGELGEGERLVRIINNAGTAVQARLLREDLSAAVSGTLHIPIGEIGVFHVPTGKYMVRYRHGSTCEVRRGALLVLTGPRAGVEISIKPRFDSGTRSRMKKVTEPL